jgi:hypothetical protein
MFELAMNHMAIGLRDIPCPKPWHPKAAQDEGFTQAKAGSACWEQECNIQDHESIGLS